MTSTRPGAIIKSHKGLTVEIKNTDAEGRLVMADAMCGLLDPISNYNRSTVFEKLIIILLDTTFCLLNCMLVSNIVAYIGSNYALNSMIDIATLTGNCTLSIGPFAVIYFSNSEDFHQKTEGWSIVPK